MDKEHFHKEISEIKVPKDEIFSAIDKGLDKGRKQKSKKLERRFKKSLVAAAVVSLLTIGALFTPPIQAAFEGIFEVSIFEEGSKSESISFGTGFTNTGVMEDEVYNSLEEIEEAYQMIIPFPTGVWDVKSGSNTDEFTVGIDEEGNLISYMFDLATDKQRFSVDAIKSSEAEVTFNAETEDGTAINKDITINGTKAKLFGVDKLTYSIYLEIDDWKLIITMLDKNHNSNSGLTQAKEEQLIKIAESIQ